MQIKTGINRLFDGLTVTKMREILNTLPDDAILFNLNAMMIAEPNEQEWFNWKPLGHINFETEIFEPIQPLKVVNIDSEEATKP